jgi:hypothetical protein
MPRRGEACAGCQRRFAAGEPLAVYLYQTAMGYERREYCAACRPAEDPPPLAIWKTRRPVAATQRTRPFDREALFRFFERLEDSDQPAQVQLRFVLGLLLWRKKLLKLERTATVAPHEIWEFTAAHAGTTHRVVHPGVDEEQLERLSGQLEQLVTGQAEDLTLLSADAPTEEAHG